MNPIYKFQLSAGNDTRQAFPVYKDDLAIDYALEQNQEFYRGKLSGKLTFQKDDYLFIRNKAFDTQFDVVISISYDGGQTWAVYWSGQFWKTDCQFNEDDQTAIVTPTINDRYNAVLAGMDKEYNLIDLAPVIQPVKLDKRPCLQIYVEGNKSVGQTIFGNNTYWETECQQPENITEYQFGTISNLYPVRLGFYDVYPPAQECLLYSANPLGPSTTNYGEYIVKIVETTEGYDVTLTRTSDNAKWRDPAAPQYSLAFLDAVSGTPADFQHVKLSALQSVHIYGRIITDVVTAWEIPANDIVNNNRNYRYCIPFDGPNNALVVLTDKKTTSATPYGLYQPGVYYDVPNTTGHWIPIAQNSWGEVSIWLNADAFAALDASVSSYLATVSLRDAYPLWSVIASLLGEFAPNISHAGTTDYSRFLYGTNPISLTEQRIFVAPKSNLISLGYDQPAQKAPITLRRVTDMLRDCFRCYWFIDEQNRFRIEHISYFMRGGTYTGQPVVGMDLTALKVTRNGKPWAYARNQYEFDKPEMAARYQFGWMDDVTELFDGFPIDIISKYVNPENIEQINVSQFTSDVDYILLSPGDISKDGFVLLAATLQSGHITYSNAVEAIAAQDYLNTIQVNIPAGSRYRVRAVGNANIYGNAFWLYRNGVITYDDVLYNNNANVYTAQENITSLGIGVHHGLVISGGMITFYVEVETAAEYKLPYVNFNNRGINYKLQNAFVSFAYLQRYYMYDLPTRNAKINGVQQNVYGIKKLKTQTIKFPVLTEPNLTNLIKTELGNGVIQKMSVNLSSRNANTTLKYDTE